MEIPYTVEVRRDTGLTNGKIGIWLFLASEVMLFGALFASYILIRTGAQSWPRGDTQLNVPLATFNTIVLISSSVTMVMAWASLKRNRFGTTLTLLDLNGDGRRDLVVASTGEDRDPQGSEGAGSVRRDHAIRPPSLPELGRRCRDRRSDRRGYPRPDPASRPR